MNFFITLFLFVPSCFFFFLKQVSLSILFFWKKKSALNKLSSAIHKHTIRKRTDTHVVCLSVCLYACTHSCTEVNPASENIKGNNCFFFFFFLEKNTSFVLLVEGVMVVNNRVGVNGRERKEGRKGFYSNYKPDNIRVYGNRFIRCDIELELSL